MKLKYILALPTAMLLLAIAFILDKFLPDGNYLDFIVGLMIGMSVLLNIYFIRAEIKTSRKE